MRAELLNEMGMQRSLDHPNIVRVYESFEDIEAGQVHIVMELCTGGCLLSRLGERLAAHGHTHAPSASNHVPWRLRPHALEAATLCAL